MTLGEYLRQERERRNLTIEQVASATKINVKLLISLEADQYSDLPAKPFVRGFVISYSRFVGLDPHQTLARYESCLDSGCGGKSSRSAHNGYAFERKDTEKSRTILLAVMGGFVVVGALVILVVKPALRHKKVTHLDRLRAAHSKTVRPSSDTAVPSKKKQVDIEVAKSPKSVVVKQDATSSAPARDPSKENLKKAQSVDPRRSPSESDPMNKGDTLEPAQIRQKVVFKALADSWIRYRVDDRSTMRFMLRKDKLLVLRAEEEIYFQTSNSKAVSFRYQNGSYASLAASDQRVIHNETDSIRFPFDAEMVSDEPFPGLSPLPKTPDP